MRWVSARVFPEPAPATMSTGPSVCSTASRCTGFSASRRGEVAPASVSVATPLSLGARWALLPGDLLGQFDHEPVGVEEVDRAMAPRAVLRSRQDLDAGSLQ